MEIEENDIYSRSWKLTITPVLVNPANKNENKIEA